VFVASLAEFTFAKVKHLLTPFLGHSADTTYML
jgi:hypothetical protein